MVRIWSTELGLFEVQQIMRARSRQLEDASLMGHMIFDSTSPPPPTGEKEPAPPLPVGRDPVTGKIRGKIASGALPKSGGQAPAVTGERAPAAAGLKKPTGFEEAGPQPIDLEAMWGGLKDLPNLGAANTPEPQQGLPVTIVVPHATWDEQAVSRTTRRLLATAGCTGCRLSFIHAFLSPVSEAEVSLIEERMSRLTKELHVSMAASVEQAPAEPPSSSTSSSSSFWASSIAKALQGPRITASRFVALVDPGLVPSPAWLRALLADMEGREEVAASHSVLLYSDGTIAHTGFEFQASAKGRKDAFRSEGCVLGKRMSVFPSFLSLLPFHPPILPSSHTDVLCLGAGWPGNDAYRSTARLPLGLPHLGQGAPAGRGWHAVLGAAAAGQRSCGDQGRVRIARAGPGVWLRGPRPETAGARDDGEEGEEQAVENGGWQERWQVLKRGRVWPCFLHSSIHFRTLQTPIPSGHDLQQQPHDARRHGG
jgi:hypothetical protein